MLFTCLLSTFSVIFTRELRKLGRRITPSDEKGILLHNIVGAEYTVCTHWLNIEGATAPTEPMVPTPMSLCLASGLCLM